MIPNETVKFDREESDVLFTTAIDNLDTVYQRNGMSYPDYVMLHNDISGLYDSFSHVDEIIKTLQTALESAIKDIQAVNDSGICMVCKDNKNSQSKCIMKNGGVCEFVWRGVSSPVLLQ